VLTVGETERDPEALEGEKLTPLQEAALVDDHDSVVAAPGTMCVGFVLNVSVGALGDAGATALCAIHPVRLSPKATCHHVIPLLVGPPMTVPRLPGASEPIQDGVLVVGAAEA
jgi:hypothetical protein